MVLELILHLDGEGGCWCSVLFGHIKDVCSFGLVIT